jgi:hypothetical protein
MDEMERKVKSFRKANKHWNIPLWLKVKKSNELSMLTFEEDQILVAYNLNMQQYGLFITL